MTDPHLVDAERLTIFLLQYTIRTELLSASKMPSYRLTLQVAISSPGVRSNPFGLLVKSLSASRCGTSIARCSKLSTSPRHSLFPSIPTTHCGPAGVSEHSVSNIPIISYHFPPLAQHDRTQVLRQRLTDACVSAGVAAPLSPEFTLPPVLRAI